MKLYSAVILISVVYSSYCQDLKQSVRGVVLDKDSHKVLEGATITIAGGGNNAFAISDSNGRFILRSVDVGRMRIECSYVGYQNYLSDNIIISVAKQPEINIEMEEDRKHTGEALVRTTRNPKLPVNRYAIVSGRSFSPEETQPIRSQCQRSQQDGTGVSGRTGNKRYKKRHNHQG